MKKLVLVFTIAACLVGVTGQASAATTGNISVTVSLVSVVSVLVTPGTWSIGPITFGQVVQLDGISAANNGTESITLNITGANGANGWSIGGSSGVDTFSVQVDNGAPLLSPTSFFLTTEAIGLNAAAITAGNMQDFDLEYTAPSSNTQTVGDSQNFTIVITASAA